MNADDLQFAADRVGPLCDDLGLSTECQQEAERLAREADLRWPVNRAPSVVAASAVYLAAALANEKVTQGAVAEAADCSTPSIRDGYRELAEHDGIAVAFDGATGGRQGASRLRIIRNTARDVLGGLRD
jgi:transcription initiation factor TFIIIB Brf1 subunit/transcription initiation factor TFIIB